MVLDSIHSAHVALLATYTPNTSAGRILTIVSKPHTQIQRLVIVLQDGSKLSVQYQQYPSLKVTSYDFRSEEITKVAKKNLFPRGKERENLESVIKSAQEHKTQEALYKKVLEDQLEIAKKLPPERKEDRRAKYKARVFHVLTGVLVTPTELLMGVARLARACAVLIAMGGAMGVTKARLQLTKDTRKIELIKRKKNQISSFASWAAKEARIALLQLIPIVGAQLANQYRMSGSLKGFVDAPAFGVFRTVRFYKLRSFFVHPCRDELFKR
jgi:hypothetical protein